ncbi:uncharacterized protein BXZ73DRAFT_22658, partial [Epithele typhae]|uniref:uncharacterized protein n=1 Tax=Epithele typhae TaxID=378194 RepID=UPI0020073BA7
SPSLCLPPGLSPTDIRAAITHTQNAHIDAPVHGDLLEVDPTLFEHDTSVYSTNGLAPLDVFIEPDHLPARLLVYDLDNITKSQPDNEHIPAQYVRVYPAPPTSADAGLTPPRVAQLYLSGSVSLGRGHHSSVYNAPLRLQREGQDGTREWCRAAVAVKTALGQCGAHAMLEHEARLYALFPRELMEDCFEGTEGGPATPSGEETVETGSPFVCPSDDGLAAASRISVIPAVVPKFYGYYALMSPETGEVVSNRHRNCNVEGACWVEWPTRLLLLEQCGRDISPADGRLDRESMLDTLERLHEAGFVNGSAYTRNMLVQPGPLSAPRGERSMDSPSFRVIDFGRG